MVATKEAPNRRRVRETVRERRWTPAEYERLGELGVFGPEDHVQLIDGVIYELSPQKVKHANGIRRMLRALRRVFGEDYQVDAQLPMVFGRSEPEPDVMVLPGTTDLASAHPDSAALVVEVSDTTLRFDRRRKMLAYARAAIPEYWIDNLVDEQLEVHRDPSPSGYRSISILKRGDTVAPLARPDTAIPVVDLLP